MLPEQYRFATDLAIERHRADLHVSGISYREQLHGRLRTCRVDVTSDTAASSIGKPKGVYLTVSFPSPEQMTQAEKKMLQKQLMLAFEELASPTEKRKTLVIGLGNRALTADAIGPAVADKLHATAHLEKQDAPLYHALGGKSLATLCPGVMAQTGMETALVAAAVVEQEKPDLVITIDALAALDTERLMRTVQLSNTGLCPGAGVGNCRMPLNERQFHVPVVSIGVPTVVNSAVLVADAFERAGIDPEKMPQELSGQESFFVSPRLLDEQTAILAEWIAKSIDEHFGAGLYLQN